MVGASAGIWAGVYALCYMEFDAEMDFGAGIVIYLLYSFVAIVSFGIFCGSVSTLASGFFVRGIYKNIK
jgi:uncharacterized membrane protein YjgN (DUF898 family)